METIYILFSFFERAFILHFYVNPLVCFSVLMKKSAVLWNWLLNAFPPRPRPSSHWQKKKKNLYQAGSIPVSFQRLVYVTSQRTMTICHIVLWICGCFCPGVALWMLDKQTSFVPWGTTCTLLAPQTPAAAVRVSKGLWLHVHAYAYACTCKVWN